MRRTDFLMLAVAAAATLALGAPACRANPLQPPTVQVERMEPVLTEAKGFVARVHGKAHNPNAIPLPVRSVTAQVTIAGRDIAEVQSTSMSTLPPNGDTDVAFDVMVPWRQIAFLATKTDLDTVPYSVTGTASVGTDSATISVPFTQSGTFKRIEVLAAGLKSVPLDLGRIRRELGDR